MAGLVLLALTAGLMLALRFTGAPHGWRLTIFPMLLFTALCLLQVHAKTCVALAARGERNLDRGTERVRDSDELRAVHAQARRITLQAVAIATALTVVFVLIR